METTPFDMRSPQCPQKGLAPLIKEHAASPMPAVQSGGSALFADVLEQKISQSNLHDSTTDPTTAALDGKNPASPTSKRSILKGGGEPVVAGKGKRSATIHSLPFDGNSGPLKGIGGEIATEIVSQIPVSETERSTFEEALIRNRPQAVMAFFLRGDAGRPPVRPAGKVSASLNEEMAPTEEAKRATPLATEMVNQARAIPATGENVPHVELSPVKNATRTAAPPYGPEAALFVQGIQHQEMGHLETETKEPPAGNPILEKVSATPAASISGGVHPPSGRHADLRSSLEGADRRTEPAFKQQAAEILKPGKEGAAPEGVPAKNPTASASATPAASISSGVHPPSGRHADLRSSLEGADRRTEPAFKQQAAGILQREKGVAAPEGALLDVRQASLSRHDHSNRPGESKEGAGGAAAPDKPASSVGSGDAAIAQATPERMADGGSSEKTFPIGDTVMETPGPAHDHPQSQNTTSHHQTRLPERDMFPFRMEMPHVVSSQDTRISATVGASGIEMQAAIDHLLEARQSASNDFGRVRILLNPPDLGAIDLDIIVRGERVQVVMTADNATVQQALQSRGDDVRMALHRHDLKMEGFQVLLHDNGASQQQTHSGAMFRQNREDSEGFNASEDNAPPAFPLFSFIAGAKSEEGLVSIFA